MNFTVYDGNISSSVVGYAKDIAVSFKLQGDYLFFRGGEYEYFFITGNIDFDTLQYTSARVIRISSEPQSFYFRITETDDQSGSISNPHSCVMYGSRPGLPQLVDSRGVILNASLCFAVGVLFVYLAFRDFFMPFIHR